MAFVEIETEGLVRQSEALERMLSTDPSLEKLLRKVIDSSLKRAAQELQQAARAAMGADPRRAYEGVRRILYKKILGGNINILGGQRGSSAAAGGSGTATAGRTGGNRGGNRMPRGARTSMIMGYEGADRAFVLRWINEGAKNRIATRLNRRTGLASQVDTGSVTATRWFTSKAPGVMESAADEISDIIDEEIVKAFSNG